MNRTSCALLVAAWLVSESLVAQREEGPAPRASDSRLAAFEAHRELARTSPFAGLAWSWLGPTNVSGRANDVAVVDVAGRRRIYVAYAGAGVWRSDDEGATWTALFARQPSSAVQSIAVAPSNPDVVWILTGTRRSLPVGSAGAFKSTDAGRTWHPAGLEQVQMVESASIGRLVIHPQHPDIVYAAILGRPNAVDDLGGIFGTVDGGRTWRRLLAPTPRSGGIDVAIDPYDHATIYATIQERAVPPARPEATLFRSRDGGATWIPGGTGLPSPKVVARIAIDTAKSRAGTLYALVINRDARRPQPGGSDAPLPGPEWKGPEIYRSDDRAATWHRTSRADDPVLRPDDPAYTWTAQVRVDPRDDQTIYTLGVMLNVSHDGGRSFEPVASPHADHNGLWIDPANTNILYECNDVGLHISRDGGESGHVALVPAAQFYNVEMDMATPFHVYSSRQDDASWRVTVDVSGGRRSFKAGPFERAPGGEATNHAIDPGDLNIVYAANREGSAEFGRFDLRAPNQRRVDITPKAPAGDVALRGPFLAAIALSPHDGHTLYVGYQYLFRSLDRGTTWERISRDLTDGPPEAARPDRLKQVISTFAESSRKAGLIYVGTDDGRMHVTTDAGKTWTDLTEHLPKRLWVSRVVPSAHDDGTVFITQHGRYGNDLAPYLFRSTDYGRTFTSLVGNIPAGPINVIREDPARPHVLYASTDFGVYVSRDDGQRWEVLGANLPTVPVTDLKVHPRDRVMVISTYGAGLWAIDADAIDGAGTNNSSVPLQFVDPRQTAMAGRDARDPFDTRPPLAVRAVVYFVEYAALPLALASAICGSWVLVNVLRTAGVLQAFLSSAFFPYAFAWGWRRARQRSLRAVMILWSISLIGFVGGGIVVWRVGGWQVAALVLMTPVISGAVVHIFLCAIWVIVRMFRTQRAWHACVGLIVPPYAFVWGWVRGRALGLTPVMAAWTAAMLTLASGAAVLVFR